MNFWLFLSKPTVQALQQLPSFQISFFVYILEHVLHLAFEKEFN